MLKVSFMAGFIVIAGFIILGCSNPLDLTESTTDQPVSKVIHDGAHSGEDQHFFFLPPMAPEPLLNGQFDGSLDPVVEIVDLSDNSVIETFTMMAGVGSESIRVEPAYEHYIVNWHTNQNVLNEQVTYRIYVFIPANPVNIELGFADVDVVNSGKKLKNVDTGEYIAIKNGRTLPVKFRIETGAKINPPTAIFTANPTSGSSDPDPGDTLTYTWDFGDGNSDNGVNTSNIYSAYNMYTVTLTVEDSNGGTDTATTTITVTNLTAWGRDDTGETKVPAGGDYVAIDAGCVHSLALKSDGSIVGWLTRCLGQQYLRTVQYTGR